MSVAEAQRLRERLRDRTTLTAAGCANHAITDESVREQPYTSAAGVEDGHLRPVTGVLRRGKAVAATISLTAHTATMSYLL